MFNLELYAIYLLDLLNDPLNATRWVVMVECAAVSASGAADSAEFTLCIGEIQKARAEASQTINDDLVQAVDKARANGFLTSVGFLFYAAPGSGGSSIDRTIRFTDIENAVKMAEGAAGAIIPGSTESYIMHDLRV